MWRPKYRNQYKGAAVAKKKKPSKELGIRVAIPPPNQKHKDKSKYIRKSKRPKEDDDE